MTTAYGSITITDLIDTATYIYYSETGSSDINNWHKTAELADKYICIYSGVPVDSTQPERPTSEILNTATISKFVGEDGENGSSLEKLIPIYYLDTNKIEPTAPSGEIVTTEDGQNKWTTIVPSYIDGGTYYVCYQSTYSDGQIGHSSVVEDNGIGKAIETAENLSIYTLTPSVSSVNKFQESKDKISLSSNTVLFSLIERKNNSNIVKELNSSNSKITIMLENPQIGAEESSWEVNKHIEYSEGKLSLKLGSLILDQELSYANIIIEQDVLIRCTFLQNTNEEVAYAVVPVRYGTSDDMAKFSLHAADITQAIGSSKLIFNAEGLKIINGGLIIQKHEEGTSDEDNVNLFYYDQGRLHIDGTGNFSGDIHANSGYFHGTIDAAGGSIGGWNIDENGLYSAESSVQLLKSGKIIAENIELGKNATITDYIALGNATLCNPEKNEGKVLNVISKNSETSEITDLITLKDDGTLKIGKLKFNGATSTITSGENGVWSISPDGATFTNINVSGKISTSIFETNKVQSVGGSMVFKTSVLIEKVEKENGKLVLITKDDEIKNQKNNYFYCIIDGKLEADLYQISSVSDNEEGKKIETNYSYSEEELPLITQIIIMETPSEGQTVCIPVINSTNAPIGKIGQPRGFTISELNIQNNTVDTRVFLGDLKQLKLSGYGLYSDNVYLKGSLTTKMTSDEDKYAGLNTLTEFTDDNGQLIFWAGAPSADITKDNINSIPFRVYSNGRIYASDGFFSGEIEASTITSTDIYAATIHDIAGQPALTIDAENTGGIAFVNKEVDAENKKIKLLEINSNGLSMRGRTFISVEGNNIIFNPHEINVNKISINEKIKISGNNIAGETGQFGNISFGTGSLSLRPTSSTGEVKAAGLVINDDEIESQSNFVIEKNLVLGVEKRIEYRKSSNNGNTNYYDLYIR